MTPTASRPSEPRLKYWTKAEYLALADLPTNEHEHFFLFRGELIEMPAYKQPHVWSVKHCTRWAIKAFEPRYVVRPAAPLDVPGDSMPEPDFAIVTHDEDARPTHPRTALLVIEVSDSTLHLDRKKAPEYASASVPIYWILDVNRRVLEVRTQIIDEPQSPTGKNYGNVRTLAETEVVETFDPSVTVLVKDLLP